MTCSAGLLASAQSLEVGSCAHPLQACMADDPAARPEFAEVEAQCQELAAMTTTDGALAAADDSNPADVEAAAGADAASSAAAEEA